MTAAPTTHFVKLAQGIIYRGSAIDVVWSQFVALAIISSVLFSVALLRPRISHFVKYLAPDSGDTGVRATVNSAMNKRQPIAEWRVSLWFAMLSPLLGILLGMLALFVFSN